MAKTPTTPRPPRRRRRRTQPTERRRSNVGKVIGAAIAAGTAATVGGGLYSSATEAPPPVVCGGTERWNVKVANDPDAAQISPNPQGPNTVAQLNQIEPKPIDPGGRMEPEKKRYTVRGLLSYFKKEDDGDYHVVITDPPGQFSHDDAAPNGRSMVVELPNPDCLRGKSGKGPATSILAQSMAEARASFEEQVHGISGTNITKSIPVTVTGVGFFDRAHGQTGRATERAEADGRKVVFELHPVTEITFDNPTETD